MTAKNKIRKIRKIVKTFTPLPTLAQFRHCHESLWERPADFAAYEYAHSNR